MSFEYIQLAINAALLFVAWQQDKELNRMRVSFNKMNRERTRESRTVNVYHHDDRAVTLPQTKAGLGLNALIPPHSQPRKSQVFREGDGHDLTTV